MFCHSCGRPLKPNSRFCATCGVKVDHLQQPQQQNNSAIAEYQNEIAQLQAQIQALSNKMDAAIQAQEQSTNRHTMVQADPPTDQEPIAQPQCTQRYTPPIETAKHVETKEQPPQPLKHKQTLESNIGKNVFAIIASLLVLIGVSIFISTIYEYIPEAIKVIAIYAFGIALTSVGVGLYFKSKNNFWLGLASCGVSELLVSIITSYTYFEVINLSVTFGLILIWVIGMFILTKVQPILFKIIGYIGFVISMCLGLSLLESTDGIMFIMLFVTYVGVSVAFALTNKNTSRLNVILIYISTIMMMCFRSGDYFIIPQANQYDMISFPPPIDLSLYIVLALIGFNGIHLWKYKQFDWQYAIYSAISLVLIQANLNDFAAIVNYIVPTTMLILTIGGWIYHVFNQDKHKVTIFYKIIACFLIIGNMSEINDTSGIASAIMWTLIIILMMLIYKRRKDFAAAIASLLFMLPTASSDIAPIPMSMLLLGISTVLFYISNKEKNEGLVIKNGWYVALLFSITTFGVTLCEELALTTGNAETIEEIIMIIAIACIVIINLIRTYKVAFNQQVGFNTKPESIFLYVLNGILLMNCLIVFAMSSLLSISQIVSMLLAFAILALTVLHSVVTNWSNKQLTMIHCIKFTCLAWIILKVYEAHAILISITILLLAIASIVVGFTQSSKPARIYGLILSFLASASLALFGVGLGSTVQVAAGIILCGLLCFVISFIYSKAAKAIEAAEKENIINIENSEDSRS